LEALSIKEICQAVGGTLKKGDKDSVARGISTDTRSIAAGDIFFALKGDRFNGHSYAGSAAASGAGALVVSEKVDLPKDWPGAVIMVDDTRWALGELAGYYRSKFNVKVIAVTGSVGKTSTKEMIASILEKKWRVLKNEMNYNNEIGVPLTLFRLDRSHQIVVLEMAMRGIGEIRRLAAIAKPSVGVITNIGLSHIERLGSQGAIADAKSELLAELPPDGTVILNAEDCYYIVLRDRFNGNKVSFGSCQGADVIGTRIKCNAAGKCTFTLLVEGGAIEVRLPVPGTHNVYNALAAAAVARHMGVDLYAIRDGLQGFKLPSMRMELTKSKRGYTILNDAYNANPASMLAALRTLCVLKGAKRRVAVLVDMLELGDYAHKAHMDIGTLIAENSIDILVTVGKQSLSVAEGAKAAGFSADCIFSFENSLDAAAHLKDKALAGDTILVKGSRGMCMEEIVRALYND
jgi:UDP-N-acetylmuramoyl-tripeptide--D-alanyl-D-alanine ligase